MKLGLLAGNICRVCGSDTLGADIGCSCIHKYNQAKFIALKNHSEDSLIYNYSIEMKYLMDKFVADYEAKLADHEYNINKIFRSDFKRVFYPSVVGFYKAKGYVSKKQLDVVKKELYAFCSSNCEEDDYKAIEKQKETFLSDFAQRYDSEVIEIARNLWKTKKIN